MALEIGKETQGKVKTSCLPRSNGSISFPEILNLNTLQDFDTKRYSTVKGDFDSIRSNEVINFPSHVFFKKRVI
jgi:hypothetical protein